MLKLMKFLVGGAAGTVVGLVVGSLLAPQQGEQLQAQTRLLVAEAKTAGAEAERETTRHLQERFRERVNDPSAFAPRAAESAQGSNP